MFVTLIRGFSNVNVDCQHGIGPSASLTFVVGIVVPFDYHVISIDTDLVVDGTPMDFEEFSWVLGVAHLQPHLLQCHTSWFLRFYGYASVLACAKKWFKRSGSWSSSNYMLAGGTQG